VVLAAVALATVSGCSLDPEPAGRQTVAVTTATVTVTAPVPAAEPTPVPPDTVPAQPDPAPAQPDPVPAQPDPAPAPPAAAPADPTPSAVAVACAAVDDELTDAVIRYEVQALAEDGPGGGDRAAAGRDMSAALDRARQAAGTVPGLAEAAAPAMAEAAALRDGMATRPELDEEDAEPWRDARDRLEAWCEGQG
jgi:hypothetical protein